MVDRNDVEDLPIKQDAETIRGHFHRLPAAADRKSGVSINHSKPGQGFFIPTLTADSGITGVIILPYIPPVSNLV